MLKYKTPIFYYIIFITYIILSLGFFIYLLIDYINLTNEEEFILTNLKVTNTLNTDSFSVFQKGEVFNFSSTQLNCENISILNDDLETSNTNSEILSSVNLSTTNLNVDNFIPNSNLTKAVKTVDYLYDELEFIYGYLCFSYYGKNSTQYYNRDIPTNFFSMYINKQPPSTSINKYNYLSFLNNSLLIKNFTYSDKIFTTDVNNPEYCENKCYRSAGVFYEDSSELSPYLEIKDIGGFINNIKIYNTMFYGINNSNKIGVLPTENYLSKRVVNFYGMNIPNIFTNEAQSSRQESINSHSYGQYASYNSINFKMELNDTIKFSDIETSLVYYDNICPRTIFYNDFYGQGQNTNFLCDKIKSLKYTYNNPDQNMILTSSNELDRETEGSAFKLSKIKHISLMTNSFYIIPSFIISFKMNVIQDRPISQRFGFVCGK